MLTTLGIGILTSHLTEVVNAINKRLRGTILQGDGAFLLAGVMSFVASLVTVFYVNGTPLPSLATFATWKTLAPVWAQVWAVMQVYFIFVMKKLELNIASQPSPAPKNVPIRGVLQPMTSIHATGPSSAPVNAPKVQNTPSTATVSKPTPEAVSKV